jgi:ligand-binding SRPBCC domain-containing protein
VPTFVKSTIIEAPVRTVFGFHEREDALALLSPPFPPVRKVGGGSGIQPGTRVELRVGPLPWVALHTAYEKDRLFVDEQVRGPFARWVHRHEFEAVDGRTRLTDRVEYELPGGRLTETLFGWTVTLGLRNMFDHRHRVTRKFCETPQ